MAMTEEQIRSLIDPLLDLYWMLERNTIERICAKLEEIGQLTATDAYQLQRLADLGSDIEAIEKTIATVTGIAQEDVHSIFYEAVKSDYDSQRESFELAGRAWVPFEENTEMQNLVETVAKATQNEMINISGTTGFVGNVSGPNLVPPSWKPLAEYYQDTVDYAILQVRSGVTDYNSVIRSTVKQLSDNGLSYIEYDNDGKRYYRRRLDSSVRNAVNGGLQRLSMAQAEVIGSQFGADGMEISIHAGARESHEWFQGQQFPMDEYHKDVEPLLNDYNCYHRAFPILLGISAPAHTPQEIANQWTRDHEVNFYDSKGYNAYQARQTQRRLETSVRTWKDRASAFGASGDRQAEQSALIRASEVNRHYTQFSGAMGLPVKDNLRTTVNFSRSQAARAGAITRKLNAG